MSPSLLDQTTAAHGIDSEETSEDYAATYVEVYTISDSLIDPYPVSIPKYEPHTDPNLRQDNTLSSELPIADDAAMSLGISMPPHDHTGRPFSTYEPHVGHMSWDDILAEPHQSLPHDEVMPFNQPAYFSPTTTGSSTEGLQNPNPLPLDPILQYGVSASEIFDFDREFGESTSMFADAKMFGQQASLSDPEWLGAEYISTTPTYLTTEEQLPGDSEHTLTVSTLLPAQEQLEHEFQVALEHEIPLPTMEALNRAAEECKQKNFYAFAAPLPYSDLAYDYDGPHIAFSTMLPRKKVKLEHNGGAVNFGNADPLNNLNPVNDSPKLEFTRVNYLDEKPRSGLIRDAHPPHADDYSEDALVYRVANSPNGRQTDFTFDDHYDTIVDCLHEELVRELNRKLHTGLPAAQNMPLVRNLNALLQGQPMDTALRRRIDFAQKGLQSQIDWTSCPEHDQLMQSLDFNKPNLSLEELDRLVKAAGVWVFENWQAAHPGQERRSH